jgi:hypothetical protein
MSNEVHDNKELGCRIRGCAEVTQAARRDRVQGATWLCRIHRGMLTLSATERAQLDELRGLIQQGQLTIDAAGWLTQVAPKPPPSGAPIVLDDGSPRYRDWDNSAVIGDVGDGE